MRHMTRQSRYRGGPNMTPMVDIVMCILIFFMLGSTFALPDLFLSANMPAVDKKGLGENPNNTALPPVRMNLELINVGGHTKLRAFGVVEDDLHDRLASLLASKRRALSDDVQLLIVPEKTVPYQDVITVYDQCVQSGFKNVAFSTPK